jgi:hypothetical protein
MSTAQLRRKIKDEVDRLPTAHLPSLASYVEFLGRPTLTQRIAAAEKALKSGKGTNWRKVRNDV